MLLLYVNQNNLSNNRFLKMNHYSPIVFLFCAFWKILSTLRIFTIFWLNLQFLLIKKCIKLCKNYLKYRKENIWWKWWTCAKTAILPLRFLFVYNNFTHFQQELFKNASYFEALTNIVHGLHEAILLKQKQNRRPIKAGIKFDSSTS